MLRNKLIFSVAHENLEIMKKQITAFLSISLLALTTAVGFAGEHPLSTIQGTQIDLKAYDHAFAGSIKGFVAFGAMDEETFTSELTFRKDGKLVKAAFAMENGKLTGLIRHDTEKGTVETALYLARIDRAQNQLIFSVNGKEMVVSITADGFANNHFMNPTYKTNFNGEEISFTLKGQACYGFSAHLAILILGAYLH